MRKQQLGRLLQLAFFPIIACALLAGHASGQTPTRVMPLGDSITGSPGCWRAMLWNQLQDNGYTQVDFVGSRPAQGCGQAHDGDNEGHGGILATNMANAGQLVPWLNTANPDIVLMHLGTNDVWSNRSSAQILAAFDTLVNQMRAKNPAIKILVAQIIPMDSARSCVNCAQGVVNLNNALPAWAAGKSTNASPISVVDQWSGFSTASHTYDGVHPNNAGDQLLANNWYDSLTELLDGGNPLPENLPPDACFTGSTSVLPGATASFSAACTTDPDGDNLSYAWSFGDGTGATTVSVQHTYSQAGSFNLTLTVDDDQGNSDTVSRVVSVMGSSSSSSSINSSASTSQQCNWYGTLYPVCANTPSGWGWESNRSCIGRSTCSSQPAPYGIVGGGSSSATRLSSRSSLAAVSSSRPSSSSSSLASSRASSSSSSGSVTGSNCQYLVSNEWSGGFTGAIRITNNGSSAINGWNLSWSYSDGSRITNSWNAAVTGSNPYAASNFGWNASIQPGQSIEFGFQGTKNGGAASLPRVTGSACN